MKSVKYLIKNQIDGQAWKQTCHHASGVVLNSVVDIVWLEIYRPVGNQFRNQIKNTVMDDIR
jgi:hypothetical protein